MIIKYLTLPVESKEDKRISFRKSLKKGYSNILIKDKIFGNIKDEIIDNKKIIGKIYYYTENINVSVKTYYVIDIIYYNNILNKNNYELNYLFYDKNMYFEIDNNNIIVKDNVLNVLKKQYIEIKVENNDTNKLNKLE